MKSDDLDGAKVARDRKRPLWFQRSYAMVGTGVAVLALSGGVVAYMTANECELETGQTKELSILSIMIMTWASIMILACLYFIIRWRWHLMDFELETNVWDKEDLHPDRMEKEMNHILYQSDKLMDDVRYAYKG